MGHLRRGLEVIEAGMMNSRLSVWVNQENMQDMFEVEDSEILMNYSPDDLVIVMK